MVPKVCIEIILAESNSKIRKISKVLN